jgi:hypothetical protein
MDTFGFPGFSENFEKKILGIFGLGKGRNGAWSVGGLLLSWLMIVVFLQADRIVVICGVPWWLGKTEDCRR